MLVEDVLSSGLSSVHDLLHSYDDLSGIDRGKLLDEFIVWNRSISVCIEISEKNFDFFFFEADVKTFHFMLELVLGELVVRIWVNDVKEDGKSDVIVD